MKITKLIIDDNLVKNRENTHLEFKKAFHSQIKSYIKSIAAFANNSGGQIIFGVENKPRKPIGLGSDFNKFNEFDNKELATCIQNCLSQNIDFEMNYFKQKINESEISFGFLTVGESTQKPVICKISDEKDKLREGAIYYRYNAKNEEIKAVDLISLIQSEKEKEKQLWLQHLQKITQIGVHKVGVFSYDGEIFAGNQKIIIDKEAIKQIKFIKEGNFVEKEGATALVLKGEIKGIESLEVISISSDPNKTHPFTITQIESELKKLDDIFLIQKNSSGKDTLCIKIVNKNKFYTLTYLISQIKAKLKIENDEKYCWKTKNGKTTVKKYSIDFLSTCKDYLINHQKLEEIFKV